jgi:hypothetical protein
MARKTPRELPSVAAQKAAAHERSPQQANDTAARADDGSAARRTWQFIGVNRAGFAGGCFV